ncbi:hypothetical protein BZA77DRAFT_287827 [Pyronema omphalodes]|nr:hypothetical protein BZA77DRAFT_287827 [Pyronema omphalodes]
MSLNSVMLGTSPHTFVPLPNEHNVFTSPVRTTFTLTPGGINSSSGVAILTNLRIIYLPASPSLDFTSFTAPILSIVDSRIITPIFGANHWTATIIPTRNGGLQEQSEIKLVFKDGGAFDWQQKFEVVKERVHAARDEGREEVVMEDLPAYDFGSSATGAEGLRQAPDLAPAYEQVTQATQATQTQGNMGRGAPTPAEPPPGYEEVQRECVAAASSTAKV